MFLLDVSYQVLPGREYSRVAIVCLAGFLSQDFPVCCGDVCLVTTDTVCIVVFT
jgi:hypothetical protein